MTSEESEIYTSGDEYENEIITDFTGDIINNYNIITLIGKGSYSSIWLAYSVNDMKYYAVKVQNPDDIKDGVEEIKILQKIPKDTKYINCLKNTFIENRLDDDGITINYLCSVYELCCGNLDNMARKGKFSNGYPLPLVKTMFKQILCGLSTIHYKLEGFHGDIKPDNILLYGINFRDRKYIDMYDNAKFHTIYEHTKKEYMKEKNLKNLSTEQKIKIRKQIHKAIIENMEKNEENHNFCNDKYFQNPHVLLTDFGFYCGKNEQFNETFGTRYYMAPEIILMGECNEKVDIWALGCTLYELCTGEILFDPHSSKRGSTDFHHLEMIINLCGEFKPKDINKSKYYKKFFRKEKLVNIIYDDNFKDPTSIKIKNKLLDHNIHDDMLVDLLEGMLRLTPNERPSINRILTHQWLIN